MEIRASYSYGGIEKPTRSRILDLQAALEERPDNLTPEEATERFVEHFFAPGSYARKMFIAEGTCVVGKIHKHAHLNILMCGEAKVVTEFGEELITGPKIWTSLPGTKRAVFALTDLEWVTVHDNPENKTDTDALEKDIIATSYEEYDMLRIEQGEII